MQLFNQGNRTIKIAGLTVAPKELFEVKDKVGDKLLALYPTEVVTPPVVTAPVNEEAEALKKENEDLKKELETLKQEDEDSKQELEALKKENEDLKVQIKGLEKDLEKASK